MAEENKNAEDAKNTASGEEAKGGNKLSKFLPLGKYFLIVLVFTVQILLAYTIVDSNYGKIYEMLNKPEPAEAGTYQMEDLVVNPAGTNGHRFLLVQISLELSDKEHIKLLEDKKMKLKQDMIEALSARTIHELTDLKEREVLRKELSEIINTTIGTPSVRNLYFTKYVMQ